MSTPAVTRRIELALYTGILLVALVLRIYDLRAAPPGAQHDETFSANFATQIIDGARPLYWDQNGGVLPLHAYLVAPFFALAGADIVSLRMVSVVCGLAAIIFTALAARRLFGVFAGLISAALMAVSHWQLFESRVGLEPVTLLMMAALIAWLFSVVFVSSPPGSTWPQRRRAGVIALGVATGLAQYTYQSAPLIPFSIAAYAGYLLVWNRARWHAQWRALVVALLLGTVVASPMVIHVLTTTGDATSRSEDLAADMRAALSGDVEPLARNIAGVAGMFAFAGDPSWRYNLAGRPVFTLVIGLLAYGGLALCVRRWRDPRFAFVVIWIASNVIASAVTRASPSYLRSSAALPLIVMLPPLALDAVRGRLPSARRAWAVAFTAALAVLLAWETTSTTVDYFTRWATDARVRTIYRADLAEIAAFLDTQQPAGTVMLSARYAADLDQNALYLMQARKQRFQWFNGRRVLVLPDDRSGRGVSYFIPATNESLSDGAGLLKTLATQAGPPDERGKPAFMLYHLPPDGLRRLRTPAPAYPLHANMNNEVELVGVDATPTGHHLHVLLYWRVLRRIPGDLNRNFFAHLVDSDGRRWTQEDRSAYPTSSWQDDDLVWQWYDLALPADAPAGNYSVELGVYDANAPGQPRLRVIDATGVPAGDAVRVGPFALR
ncbi:MAG: glycosyltransferase family 39 protein [Chloroflexi bacterium]|nr:glycosyltransferase family 39 protein [Chloroflexota bacterium]